MEALMSDAEESFLPINSTAQERALAETVTQFDPELYNIWSPWDCPADILPWLAWALSVDTWDSDWDEQVKRRTIADSVKVHQLKGTVGALKRALQAIGYEVLIDENTGQAYTFRLQIQPANEQELTNEVINEIEEIAETTKNARSHLLSVDTLLVTNAKKQINTIHLDGTDDTVTPYWIGALEANGKINIIGSLADAIESDVYPKFKTDQSASTSMGSFLGVTISTTTTTFDLNLNV